MTNIAREKIQATDEEIEQAFEATHVAGCPTIEELCFGLLSEFDNFKNARKKWAIPGRIIKDTDNCFVVEGARAMKNQEKRTVCLIRFGEYVAISGMDR